MPSFLLVLLGLLFSQTTIGSPVVNIEKPADYLVDAEWLASALAKKDLRILDIRSKADYEDRHIKGAVSLPVEQLFASGHRNDLVAPIGEIQKLLSKKGVGPGTTVVVYDDGTLNDAARAFWVLELYGHDHVHLLDGGFHAWKKRRFSISSTVTIPDPKTFIPTVKANRLATKLSTRLAMNNPNVVILDARSELEYIGKETHTGKYGRIPTSINVPTTELFSEIDGVRYLKHKNEIAEIYGSIDSRKKVITYCNIGKKSALTYFNLRRLGHDTANYDGSWKEWGGDSSLPIEPNKL